MKVTMNFTLDESVIKGLRMLAQAQDRPLSRVVNQAVADYIARHTTSGPLAVGIIDGGDA